MLSRYRQLLLSWIISIAEGLVVLEVTADADGELVADLQPISAPAEHCSLQRPATAVCEDTKCVVCLESANVMLQPCGHLCDSSGCKNLLAFKELLTGSCPMWHGEGQSSITLEPWDRPDLQHCC